MTDSHQKNVQIGFKKWLSLLGLVIVLACGYWAFNNFDLTEYLQPSRLVEFIQSFGAVAPLVFIGIMALAVVVSPIPSIPLDLAAGVAFGPWLGTLYAVIGAEIGAIVSFLIGRRLGRDVIARLLKSDVVFCEKCSDHHLFGFIVLSRLLPVFSFDLVSYGAGLTTMSLKAFAVATFLGMVPPTFAIVYFGSSTLAIDWIVMLLGVILVGFFIVLPKLIIRHQSTWWVRMIQGKKPEVEGEQVSVLEPMLSSESSSQCSWCGTKEQV
ncbi:TVP38/TMEM64 family protein [Nitrospira sp. M1]